LTTPSPKVQVPYLFALVDDGGVAVNVRTGSWSALNTTAAAICRAFQQRLSWQDARTMVQERWRMSSAEAAAAVEAVRFALEESCPPAPFDDTLPYRRRSHDYALFHGGIPILSVDFSGDTIRLEARPATRRASLSHYLRLVSPKVLAARGHLVLHSASCLMHGKLAAFVGASGAGKSTTTDLLAEVGATKLTDELLVVSPGDSQALAYPEAEGRIYAWCEAAAKGGASRPDDPISTAGLLDALEVSSMRLDRIIALSGKRRPVTDLSMQAIAGGEALEALLSASFLGAVDPPRLAHHLEGCRRLRELVPTVAASVPEGLDALRQAAGRYIAKTAS
jgi:hypothetical protein